MLTDGFVLRQIKKYNVRLLVFTIVLIGIAAVLASSLPNYWYNLKNGPFSADADTLAEIDDTDSLKEYYVKIQGEKVYTFIKDDGFLLLNVNDALLVIKGEANENSLEFVGQLKNLSDNDEEALYQALKKKVDVKKLKGRIYPVVLEAGDIKGSKTFDYVIIALLIILVIRNIIAFVRRASNPELHPICKFLSAFGTTGEMVNIVDSEVERAQEDAEKSSTIITDSWIIFKGFFKLQFIPLSDVVWAYQKITSHRLNYIIPAGKTYELIVYTKDKEKHEIKAKNGQTGEQAIELIGQNAPWALTGYSIKLEDIWKKNPTELIRTVQDRIEQIREYGEESLQQ